jgi:hypothetical protein
MLMSPTQVQLRRRPKPYEHGVSPKLAAWNKKQAETEKAKEATPGGARKLLAKTDQKTNGTSATATPTVAPPATSAASPAEDGAPAPYAGKFDPPDAHGDAEVDVNANERRYCYCNGVAWGSMVGCDSADCEEEWLHLECVGLKSAPSATSKLIPRLSFGRDPKANRYVAKWYCDDCKNRTKNGKNVTVS